MLVAPAAMAWAANSSARRVLPMPASPSSTTRRPSCRAASYASRSADHSADRPTSGDRDSGATAAGGGAGRSRSAWPCLIVWYSAVVSSSGATPSSRSSTRTHARYWRSAAPRCPLQAYSRMSCRWAGSWRGSRASHRWPSAIASCQRPAVACTSTSRSSTPASSRRRLSAWRRCQSSKPSASRSAKPARKSPRWSAAASRNGARQAGQVSASGWPCAPHSASSAWKRARSNHRSARSRAMLVRSVASQPPRSPLLSADSVRRSAARACASSYSGHSSRAIALRVSTSTAAPSSSRRGGPSTATRSSGTAAPLSSRPARSTQRTAAGVPDRNGNRNDARTASARHYATSRGGCMRQGASKGPSRPAVLALGLSLAVAGPATGYADYGALARPDALPGAGYAALYHGVDVLLLAACLGFVLLLTPTGSLPSPRWHWWARVAAAAPLLAVVSTALLLFDLPYQSVANPLAVPALAAPLRAVNNVTWLVTTITIPVAAGSLVVRYRRARGIERQQLRWLALAAALAAATVLALVALAPTGNEVLLGWLSAVCVALLPLATGAAILRYRLYDLDRIISRTLAYGLLTLL